MRFKVWYLVAEGYPGTLAYAAFDTEREARQWINRRANGTTCYELYDGLTLIVASSWPVLMVA